MDNEIVAMVGEQVARFADRNYSFLQRWAVLKEPSRYSPSTWTEFANLGWLALCVPEDQGGLGGDARAVASVMETVGRRLLMEPILAHAVVATFAVSRLASPAQLDAWLPELIDGSAVTVFADDVMQDEPCQWRNGALHGQRAGILHGDVANRFLVPATDEEGRQLVIAVDADAPGVERIGYELVDGRGAALVRFQAVVGDVLTGTHEVQQRLQDVRDMAAVALCAETLGIVRSLVGATTEYLKVRKQFGTTIGSNQALQHRAVEMFLLQEEIKALSLAAQSALETPPEERQQIISGSRAYIIEASRRIANEAIQMHGGLGVTDELDVSHYFRRLMVSQALFGDRDSHFERFAASFEA
jgi:alkylation response protein AidB-like acyl-CoA dehydrogenase